MEQFRENTDGMVVESDFFIKMHQRVELNLQTLKKKNYQDSFITVVSEFNERRGDGSDVKRLLQTRTGVFEFPRKQQLESRALSIRILLHLRTITIVLIASRDERLGTCCVLTVSSKWVLCHRITQLDYSLHSSCKTYGSNKLTPWDDEWMIFYTESRTHSSRKSESLRSVAVNANVSATILKSLI